jgi:hypothetical protein
MPQMDATRGGQQNNAMTRITIVNQADKPNAVHLIASLLKVNRVTDTTIQTNA